VCAFAFWPTPARAGLPELVFQSRSKARLLRLAGERSLAAAAAAIRRGRGLLGLSLLAGCPVTRAAWAPVARTRLALYEPGRTAAQFP